MQHGFDLIFGWESKDPGEYQEGKHTKQHNGCQDGAPTGAIPVAFVGQQRDGGLPDVKGFDQTLNNVTVRERSVPTDNEHLRILLLMTWVFLLVSTFLISQLLLDEQLKLFLWVFLFFDCQICFSLVFYIQFLVFRDEVSHCGLLFEQIQDVQILVELIEGFVQDVFFENALYDQGKRVFQEVERRNCHSVEDFVVINLFAQVDFKVVVQNRSDHESEENDEDGEPGEEFS